jgi:hypothetical protein
VRAGLEKDRFRAHIPGMTDEPTFNPKMTNSGSWFVSVITGCGPDSHVGDFATEEEAQRWIVSKSKYWPSKPDQPK